MGSNLAPAVYPIFPSVKMWEEILAKSVDYDVSMRE